MNKHWDRMLRLTKFGKREVKVIREEMHSGKGTPKKFEAEDLGDLSQSEVGSH